MSGPFAWLQANPSVREAVLRDAELDGKALPDALLADPLKLIDLSKAVVIEAVKRDAPEGVVEGLMVPVRRMVRFGSQVDQYGHLTATFSQAQGLRDRSELEPVFEQALATAPDEANKRMLQLGLDVLAKSASLEELVVHADEIVMKPNGGATELSPGAQCAICCGLGCLLCEVACLACCVVGCVACGSSGG
jgi:hypothetical protein